MTALLSFHAIATQRGDGLLPELAALYARPIPRLAEPVDVLPLQSTNQITMTIGASPEPAN
jgi:hypothetical protein